MLKFYSSVLGLKSVLINDNVFKRVAKISLFLILTIIGAKIEISVEPVPFTLQTLFVVLSGAFLGKKDGFIAQSFYLLLGAIGIPVFAGPLAGLAKLIGPTGGYLLSFPIAAFIAGYFYEKWNSIVLLFIATILSVLSIYLYGVVHLNLFYLHDFNRSIMAGAAIFSVWEIVKIIAAVFLYKGISR